MDACVSFIQMMAGISKCINALSKIETRNTTNVVALCVAMHTPCTQSGSTRTARTYRKKWGFWLSTKCSTRGRATRPTSFFTKVASAVHASWCAETKARHPKKNVELWQQSGRVIYKAFTQYKG